MHGIGDLSIGTLAQAYNGIIPRGGTWDVVPSRLWHYLTTNNSAHHDIMAQIGFDLLTSSCKRASLALADDVHIIVATIPRAVFIFSAVFTPCFLPSHAHLGCFGENAWSLATGCYSLCDVRNKLSFHGNTNCLCRLYGMNSAQVFLYYMKHSARDTTALKLLVS